MYEPKIRVVEQRHQSVLAPDREGLVSVMGFGCTRVFSLQTRQRLTHTACSRSLQLGWRPRATRRGQKRKPPWPDPNLVAEQSRAQPRRGNGRDICCMVQHFRAACNSRLRNASMSCCRMMHFRAACNSGLRSAIISSRYNARTGNPERVAHGSDTKGGGDTTGKPVCIRMSSRKILLFSGRFGDQRQVFRNARFARIAKRYHFGIPRREPCPNHGLRRVWDVPRHGGPWNNFSRILPLPGTSARASFDSRKVDGASISPLGEGRSPAP